MNLADLADQPAAPLPQSHRAGVGAGLGGQQQQPEQRPAAASTDEEGGGSVAKAAVTEPNVQPTGDGGPVLGLGAGKPVAAAESGDVTMRVVIDEARSLPAETSGAPVNCFLLSIICLCGLALTSSVILGTQCPLSQE